MKWRWFNFKLWLGQWTLWGNTICFLNDGIWMRFEWWKDQGWWCTWSVQKRFGERFGYEFPRWQVRMFGYRVAVFFMEQPGWSMEKEQENKRKLRLIK